MRSAADLRFASASCRRPAFAFAAILTLALGIGATTAIFSVVYSALVKPLPYPNADELVRIRHTPGHRPMIWFVADDVPHYRQANRTFAQYWPVDGELRR